MPRLRGYRRWILGGPGGARSHGRFNLTSSIIIILLVKLILTYLCNDIIVLPCSGRWTVHRKPAAIDRIKREKIRRMDEILLAARSVMLAKSYTGATMDEIAAEAGITNPPFTSISGRRTSLSSPWSNRSYTRLRRNSKPFEPASRRVLMPPEGRSSPTYSMSTTGRSNGMSTCSGSSSFFSRLE